MALIPSPAVTVEVLLYANLADSYLGELKDVNGNPSPLGSTDKLRLKIGRTGAAPKIDLVSAAGIGPGPLTPNGSSLSIQTLGAADTEGAKYLLSLNEADMSMAPGTYDLSIILVTGESDIHVQFGVVHVMRSPQGNFGP